MGIPSCPQPHPTPSITWFLSENNTCLRQSPVISKPVHSYYRAGCWKWRNGEKFQVSPVDRLAYKQDADSITLSLFPWLVTTTLLFCQTTIPMIRRKNSLIPSFCGFQDYTELPLKLRMILIRPVFPSSISMEQIWWRQTPVGPPLTEPGS